jgi:hypothetical protein
MPEIEHLLDKARHLAKITASSLNLFTALKSSIERVLPPRYANQRRLVRDRDFSTTGPDY